MHNKTESVSEHLEGVLGHLSYSGCFFQLSARRSGFWAVAVCGRPWLSVARLFVYYLLLPLLLLLVHLLLMGITNNQVQKVSTVWDLKLWSFYI